MFGLTEVWVSLGTLPSCYWTSVGMAEISKTGLASPLSQGELQTLKCLMARLDTSNPIASSTFFAYTGIQANASTMSSAPWIIDSGATDHMTSCSSFFDSF